DIAIGPDGIPWIIGTNFRNSSFQVWHWTGVEWTPDAGSGQEIDVDANSEPVVNGADDKIWVRNGGPDQGWSRITGKALDMGALNSVNGNGLWIVGTDHRVWNLTNGVWDRSDTPSTTQIAVTPGGVPWTVDAAGELNIGS